LHSAKETSDLPVRSCRPVVQSCNAHVPECLCGAEHELSLCGVFVRTNAAACKKRDRNLALGRVNLVVSSPDSIRLRRNCRQQRFRAERGVMKVPNSRSLSCRTTKVNRHFFSSSLMIFPVEVVETHKFLERVHAF
jgi:hypothetical protein